jgi:hypothetical protein
MRPRRAVLALGISGVLLAAVPAAAAEERCSLSVASKVVIAAEVVRSPVRLADDCTVNGADHASWDLVRGGAVLGSLDFRSEDLAEGVTAGTMTWFDADPKGVYTSRAVGAATGDGGALGQNSPVTTVKYASRLVTHITRARTGVLTWRTTAQQWSGRAHGYVGRPRVRVGLFHRTSTTAPWRYVKSATTTSRGAATLTMTVPKRGYYRLAVGETPTIWSSYSRTVRGRS